LHERGGGGFDGAGDAAEAAAGFEGGGAELFLGFGCVVMGWEYWWFVTIFQAGFAA